MFKKLPTTNYHLPPTRQKGFTLIETLIYSVIFSIMLSSVIMIFFGITKSQAQNKARGDVEAEANFVMQKIEWAMSGAQVINSPISSSTAASTSISKYNYGSNPIIFDIASGTARMKRGASSTVPLTTSNVIASLSFYHVPALGSSPEGLQITLTITATGTVIFVSPSTTLSETLYIKQ